MPRGGRQPGAGRPKGSKNKGTIDKEAAREILREMVKANLRPLVDAQIANAKGLKYLVYRESKTGKFVKVKEDDLEHAQDFNVIEVWDKDPSNAAFTDLINRTLDMPAKPLEQHSVALTIAGLDERIRAARKRVSGNG